MRGRHQEIDRGEQKVGEAGSFKVKSECVYYKKSGMASSMSRSTCSA